MCVNEPFAFSSHPIGIIMCVSLFARALACVAVSSGSVLRKVAR